MCGIVGYIGKNKSLAIGLEGLKRLEYRGYDSAGVAVFNNRTNKIQEIKSVGKISQLERKLKPYFHTESNLNIWHTRWATHGSPSTKNAHPHSDCKKNIWMVHNGIIENWKELKQRLLGRGHRFRSDTDTEIIPHLIEEYFTGNLEKAVIKALRKIKGAYALAIISRDDPQKIVAARNSSPLVIGVGNEEYIVASDASPIFPHTNKVVYLNDGEVAVITQEGLNLTNLNQESLERLPEELNWSAKDAQKGGFPHFTLKEIYETPEVIENSFRGRIITKEGLVKLGGLEGFEDRLRKISKIIIVAMGTAYNAGLVGEYMLEEYAGITTEVENAAEFRYRKPIIDKNTAVLAISQSGETADTLAAIREAKQKGALTLGIVNVVGSSVAREIDAGVYNHAGPEIGVASTKAFNSQLAVLVLLTLFLGRQRQMSQVMGKRVAEELLKIPQKVQWILKQDQKVKELAKKYKTYTNFLYLGRKYNYPIALEGALKLKELSYVHAEGYEAAEMKHGPIAMIDENFPSLFIAPSDSVYEKVVSNIEEIKARRGLAIVLATQGNRKIRQLADDIIYIPKTLEMLTPLLSVIPLQLFAYHIAVLRGCDVDKPRNLAKSVTVE